MIPSRSTIATVIAKGLAGISASHRTANRPTTQMSVVPKSDCAQYMNRRGATTITAMRMPSWVVSRFLVRYSNMMRAAYRMNTGLANSDGWKEMGPRFNQRCAPKLAVPMEKVRISKIKDTSQKLSSILPIQERYGRKKATKAQPAMAITANKICSVA